jgi:hypothetical protein
MQISAEGYGRPLRNSVRIEKTTPEPVSVIPLQ